MDLRLLGRSPLRLALYALLALVLVWPLLGDAARFNEFRDSQILMLYERAAVDSVKRFGEWPLWNPFYCGGLDGVGAPQSRFVSPTFLLSLLFGAERAELPIVWLMVVLGMEGGYRWLRLRVVNATAAALVAPVFALSGHFAVAYYRGWTGFFGFELVPWILLGVTLAARGRVGGIAIASIAFAIVLGFGGTFAAPLVAVAALFEGVRAIEEAPGSGRARAFAMLVATASFMAAVAALRLFPVAETLTAAPRIMAGTPGNTPKALLDSLVGALAVKDGDVEMKGSFYIGAAFLAVAALGGAERKAFRAMVICILFMWLSQGYARKPAPFALLRELPVFAALRYPERFLWLAILFACEPAAHAMAKIPYLGEGRKWRAGATLLLSGAIVFTIGNEIATFERVAAARTLGTIAPVPSPMGLGFHQARGNRWLAAHVQSVDLGSLSCWEAHPVLESPLLRGDRKDEEYFADPKTGRAVRVAWSPNRIIVDATAEQGGRLLVNQNWDPGWESSIGHVVDNEGLLAVDLPPGKHLVTLAFRPWSVVTGLGVSAAALLALGVLALRASRGRLPFTKGSWVATGALVVMPWIVAVAAKQLSPQPPWPAPALRNPNGTPAIVDAVPPEATKVDAKFELPITVEAVRVQPPDAHKNVMVDVWLRRTGSLPKATSMFAHFERRGQSPAILPKDTYDFFNADHQVVGGSFYLSDAPEGALVHDAFALHVDKAYQGDWDVLIGFGHVGGRRGRSKVVSPGTAQVKDDRVVAGSFEAKR
jgi:hypothetical protein